MKMAALISCLYAALFLYFGINGLRRNPGAKLNRVFLLLCVNNALMAFFAMLQHEAQDLAGCLFWNRFYLIATYISIGLFMHFHLVYCGEKCRYPIFRVLAYLPTFIYSAYVLSGRYFFGSFELGPFGWYATSMPEPWIQYANMAIFAVFATLEILILLLYWHRQTLKRLRRQALVLLASIFSSFLFSAIYYSLILKQSIHFPGLTFAPHIIWVAGMWIALLRYDFLGLSISFASRAVASNVQELILLVRPDGSLLETNEAFHRLSAYTRADCPKLTVQNILHGRPVDQLLAATGDTRPCPEQGQADLLTAAGLKIPLQLQLIPLFNRLDELEGSLFIAQDQRPYLELTELNRQNTLLLEENRLLLVEVHHRIKNNMNIMRSLLSLQSASTDEPAAQAVLSEAEGRITSMAVLYDKLYLNQAWACLPCDRYLGPLVDEIVSIFPQVGHITVTKELQNFELGSRQLMPVGIIVNELITNAMKYAFADRPEGALLVRATADEKEVRIEIADDGGAALTGDGRKQPAGAGFGLELVEGLAGQLDGSFRLEQNNGTRCTLLFPRYQPD
ncbi:MAG: ATP-binding protein [Spirochaetes bacterium]|nr:ATP-binding protein [Spirochaetota bacterium]